jgi:hypothetical protein
MGGVTGSRTRAQPKSLGVVALLAYFVAAACAAPESPRASAPPLTPVPIVTVAPSPSGVPVEESERGSTILDAIRALDRVTSYRFVVATSDRRTSGTIINGDPLSSSTSSTQLGSLPMKSIVIGDDEWSSSAGGTWDHEVRTHRTEDGTKLSYGHPFHAALPVELNVDEAFGMGGLDFYPPFMDLGVEDRNGVSVRHLQAIGDGTLTQPGDGSTIEGAAFQGTFDAWIAVQGGYLVAIRIEGRWGPDRLASPAPDPGPDDLTTASADVQIDGVDDPANVIEPPKVAPATPKPSGDPAVIALLKATETAGERLPAYELHVRMTQGGFTSEATTTVSVGPPFRARQRIVETSSGPAMDIIVIGDDVWFRDGDGPWQPPEPSRWGCDAGVTFGACAAARMRPPSGGTFAQDVTYARLPGEEVIDGVPTIHLRSVNGDPSTPGTADTWIAVDGGYLIRETFVGEGIDFLTELRSLDPSTVVIEPPA